ncbi:hypothetical protein [Streptomyces pakalii]|uniref:HPP family protein n=1 Tax=Streptomyces pakalii TaxID=3036494 RepID=A0ABT7DHR3_9ACTN|nr:hypothetical protein [Streptomyces pakalii]MDJ1645372.1 hypothetical protein [Streptomyces pakalii]
MVQPVDPPDDPVETLDARIRAHTQCEVRIPTEDAAKIQAKTAADPERETSESSDFADPVDGLVHTAATARSLDEVLELVRLLEQAPEGDEAAGETVHTAAVERPVDDVAELVARLSEPPQPADRADQAIHAAAALRPISDISHLMALLHRPPHDPHTGEQAVHAAVTGLTVEELAELISRLQTERAVTTPATPHQPQDAPPTEGMASEAESRAPGDLVHKPGPQHTAHQWTAAPGHGPVQSSRPARRPSLPLQTSDAPPSRSPSPWLRMVTAAALVLCGAAHFPLHPSELTTTGLALSAGTAGLCLLLALGVLLRNAVPAMALGTLFTGLLAAAHVIIPKTSSATLAPALHTGGVFATLSAVLAALICLLALCVTLARKQASDQVVARMSSRAQRDRV